MKKILVIDDDPAIVDCIQMLLEMEGYTVETMTEGATVEAIKKIKPDLIFLDIWMSGEDGRVICLELKKNNSTKNIPIIIISASNNITESAKAANADDSIEKPFEMDYMLDMVKKYTNQTV